MGGLKSILLLFALACTPTDSEHFRDATEQTFEYISRSMSSATKLSRDATVKITAFDSKGFQIGGSGAYVKYKKHHFVLTAAHVVAAGDTALVTSGSERVIAEVVYLDRISDIAVLRLEGLFTRKPLTWNPNDVRVGTDVIYTGFPNNHNNLTIEGTVSGFMGKYIILHSYAWGGASGSVVLDEGGRIVGIVSAIDVGYAFGTIPQLVEDIVLVSSIKSLKVEDLLASLSI